MFKNACHLRKIYIAIAFLWLCKMSLAQDIHYSQFWMNPIAVNPAATGFFDGDARAGIYNRSQWYTVTKAYQTNGLWFDLPIIKRPSHQDLIGFGMTFDYDCAGYSQYTTLQSNAMFSYAHALNHKNNHFLMVGISGGIAQRTIDYATLSFDEQYKNDIFKNTNPITEDFPTSSFLFGDCAAGLQWFYQPTKSQYYQMGLSTFHLNMPYQSLLNDKSIRMPIKYNAQFVAGFGINNDMIITPSIFYSQQGQYRELLLGCLYSYIVSRDQRGNIQKFEIGVDYRWNDAIYVVIGSEIKRVRFNFSYDFNISKLTPASDTQGGVELSVYYIFKKKKTFKRQDVPCPIW